MPPPVKTEPLAPQLHVWDVAAITAGIIIGAGIYESTPLIARSVGGSLSLMGMWIIGGLIALAGACCYAELASTYPRQGGTYVYLHQGIGRWAGFMYVWCEFWVVRPANIGAMAFVFAKYAGQLFPAIQPLAIALGVVLAIGVINLLGVHVGKQTQMVLTLVKVAGLLALFVAGMFLVSPSSEAVTLAAPANHKTNYFLALVLILFTYGGWNETAAVTAEVRDPQRNMLRGLLLGTLIVMTVYLLVNFAWLRGLGWSGLKDASAPAAALMEKAAGTWGARFISVLVCISSLSAINGMLFTGARIYYALGIEEPAFAWLGNWHKHLGTPVRALALQTVVALTFVSIFGVGGNGFEKLVLFSTPVFWSFLLMVSIAVFTLRQQDPALARPFRLPLFPLEPLIFAGSSALMVYSAVDYLLHQTRDNAFWFCAAATFLPVLVGVVVYFLTRRFRSRAPNLAD